MNPVRRIRAIAVVAVSWGVAWGAAGLVIRLAPFGFFNGAVSGALFASALMLAEQSRGIRELSRGKIALWGALSSNWMLILLGASELLSKHPSPIHGLPLSIGFNGILGGSSALATLWIARRQSLASSPITAEPTPVSTR